MQRDRGYLLDILESARLSVQYLEGKTEKDFYDDTKSQDAVIRRFEVIGEAARRISDWKSISARHGRSRSTC